MSEEAMRKAFEAWWKDLRYGGDGRVLAWNEWQAATRAAVPAWLPIKDAPTTGRDLLVITGPNMFPQIARSNTWFVGGFPAEYKPTMYIPLPPTQDAEP